MLMRAAAAEYKWNLNNGGIALMWRGGCIIRSAFLGEIKKAFDKHPKLSNLLLDPFFKKAIKDCQRSWRNVVAMAAKKGIPVPAFSTALAFYDGYRTERLPANLLPGAARLFRRAHLRTRGPAARPVFPHQLDRPRRHNGIQHLHGVNHGGCFESKNRRPDFSRDGGGTL